MSTKITPAMVNALMDELELRRPDVSFVRVSRALRAALDAAEPDRDGERFRKMFGKCKIDGLRAEIDKWEA